MKKQKPKPSKIVLPAATGLPVEKDFDPFGGDLDCQYAWKNFGGLDLDSACKKFCEKPFVYQEDFMFMGPKAFRFYFPVIDRFLRNASNAEEFEGDCEAWILGKAVRHQMDHEVGPELLEKIDGLCQFVRAHKSQYTPRLKDQQRLDKSWVAVEKHVAKLKKKSAGTPAGRAKVF